MTTVWLDRALARSCKAFDRNTPYQIHFILFWFFEIFRYFKYVGDFVGGYIRRRAQPSFLPSLKSILGSKAASLRLIQIKDSAYPSLTRNTLSVLFSPELANYPLSCPFRPVPQE